MIQKLLLGWGGDFQGAQNNAQMHFFFQRTTRQIQEARTVLEARDKCMLGCGDRNTVPGVFYNFVYQLQPQLCQLVCGNFTLDP